MRCILKKLSSAKAVFLLAAVMILGCTAMVYAADEDALKDAIIMTAEGLTDTIIELPEEQIQIYASSGDAFTESAMNAWLASKEELGARKEDSQTSKETEVSYSNGEYTVTVPVAFEKLDADFVYVFDKTGIPTSMAVNVQYAMADTLKRAGMNTVMGLGTVFVVLIFLTFVIYLFRYIPDPEKKKAAEKEAAPVPAPAPSDLVPAKVSGPEEDLELVAVIAAAIAAAEGTAPDGFVVRSIRKINRKRR